MIILPQHESFLNLVPDRDNFIFYDSLNEIKDEFNFKDKV